MISCLLKIVYPVAQQLYNKLGIGIELCNEQT